MGRPPTITRDQLLETARRVFGAKGYEAATLADIASELNVTAAAVLRHARSKQALFAEAMRPRVELPEFIRAIESIAGTADPGTVLRALAENFVPFLRRVVTENLVVFMHARSRPSLVMPFDPKSGDSPPHRAVRILEDYFRRAAEAGTVSIADSRAAARLFIASLQGYVLLHYVIEVPMLPLPRYVDALVDLWTHGGVVPPRSGGSRGRKKVSAAADRDRLRARRDRGGGGGDLLPARGDAPRDRSRRNARSENGQRRVARRRSRRRDPDR